MIVSFDMGLKALLVYIVVYVNARFSVPFLLQRFCRGEVAIF